MFMLSNLKPISISRFGTNQDDEMTGTNANETFYASWGNDEIFGWGGDDFIYGGYGNDIMQGGRGADTMDGGSGIDTVSYQYSSSGVTIDLQNGSGSGGDATGDKITNVENITGSYYGDHLFGDMGANTIDGSFGNDVIDGGYGSDIMIGGGGDDIFVGRLQVRSHDVIKDFEIGDDLIDMSQTSLDSWEELTSGYVQMQQDGENTVIELHYHHNSASITLEGIQMSDLSANDFIF